MPDIGLIEIALIGILAIIVVKPEEWPKLLRTVGHYYGTVHRYLLSAKSQSRQLYDDITTLADSTDEPVEDSLDDDTHPQEDEEYDASIGMSYDTRTKWKQRFAGKKYGRARF